MSQYKSKNHSNFILKYHMIFVCKYRKSLLGELGDKMKSYIFSISQKYDFDILEMEVDGEHTHLMVESEPKISPLQMIRVLKQQSTHMIWLKALYSKSGINNEVKGL